MKAQKSKSSDMHANLEKKTTPSDGKDKRNLAKSKLMADLFSGDSENKMEERSDSRPDQLSASSNVRSAKKDKSKLMAELFGNNPTATQESSQNPNSGGDKKSIGGSNTRQTTKKSKDEITFDDDDDDLFGGLGESEKKNTKSVSDSPKDSGFLDSLLAKSNASEKKQTDIKKTSEFILDEKYINMSKAKKEEQESFGGYKPSVGKLDSPRRRTPKKSPATDPFDILGDSQPRRPNLRSGTQRKTLELDDDILGTRRSNKGSNRQQEKEIETKSESDLNKGDAASSASQVKAGNRGKDDWLFNGLGSEASKAKKNTVTEPAEPKEDGTQKPSSSASKSPDWLGSLLSCDKKSSGGSNQVVSTSSMPDGISAPSVHHSPATPHFESKDIGGGHPSKDLNTTLPDAKSASSTTTLVLPASSGTNEQLQLLKEHQDAQLQNAAQMKAQQDLIEAQMALQVQQQQQQMANEIKQQQATMKRYQEAMLNMTQLTPTSVPLANKPDNDDELKDLKVSLRSAEIEVARLQAELDLIRKQHSKEISLLEDAQIRKMNVEKEVWEQTEKRLREERDSAVIELQSKLSALQSEKDNLVTSYDVQLGSVKSEWSHALERTKELYKGMMERMKDEHSEALQRITDLKELELKAAVSASGHVRDVEVVMNQLESNASNLSEITAIINSKQDSALEMTQRALKIKEKQLKDFEAQLSAAQAENGSERGRLNTLIHRLENTLIQQGSEVEKERWSMAQKVMKIEVERQAINEERRHMQHSVETERQNLARAREILMDEHRAMLQDISQKKQELESQRAQLSTQKKLNELHSTNVLANTSAWGLRMENGSCYGAGSICS
ncbi:fas-binding factor 1 homolog isoform X2 [Penaeus japonicus]|uniref:fas-binding factor 1 homolog isoform X2 n=1 Tax=Penaeus japonicus TaxID=27405 RepID=UPI001C70B084|nr:fas-binding factor 1 homolog isoform X2 [Penaeus japonicus]